MTIRPSVHGDVLHSRPIVINYGDEKVGDKKMQRQVVFYGSNDGQFRAVNGSQTDALGSVPPGGELWSFVLPEHFGKLNRLRVNTPELRFPSTPSDTPAAKKDYFVDGATGVYQKLDADGNVVQAYIYLTMRRGGTFIYALDVTEPTTPTVLWKISSTGVFAELGQSWSRPRLTLINSSSDPVLIFGAGYDPKEDTEPPSENDVGRGIFIVNAEDGALIWQANPTCKTSATCRNVPDMTHAVPSDIAFVDRDNSGRTDKLYFGDVGGNVWRADINNVDSTAWTVTRLATLGCDEGAPTISSSSGKKTCANGNAPRKFFFPPSVLSVKPATDSSSYDAVMLASGDREHPLEDVSTGSAFNVNNSFFLIKDKGTAVSTPVTADVTKATLFNATSTKYVGSVDIDGFYISFEAGEKAVNAPLTVFGTTYFGTNQPTAPEPNSCSSNLGKARGYAVNPFEALYSENVFPGGGLPPSPVSGWVTMTYQDSSEKDQSILKNFCIGCVGVPTGSGGKGAGEICNSALENCGDPKAVKRAPRRTYWYKK